MDQPNRNALVCSMAGPATAQRVKAGRERMEVATLRITDAGRRVLAAMKR